MTRPSIGRPSSGSTVARLVAQRRRGPRRRGRARPPRRGSRSPRPAVGREQAGDQGRRQRPGSRPVLADREGRRRADRDVDPEGEPGERPAEDRARLGSGEEVARAARSRDGSPVVPARRVVQRDLHEPGERHRPGPRDLVADRGEQDGVRRDGRPNEPAPASGPRLSPAQGQPQPRPDEAVPAEDDRDRGVGSRTRQRRAATDRRSVRPAGGRSRSDPRPPASLARRRRTGGRAAPGCRRARRRRARPGRSPSASGPSRSRSRPRLERAGRWPAARVRNPRSSISARVRDAVDRSSQARPPADTRPATTSSRRGSATTVPMAARRSATRSDDPVRSRAAAIAAAPAARAPAARRCRTRAASACAGRSRRSPPTSASQRGRALSVAQVAAASSRLLGLGDRDDIGGVAVVRERDPARATRPPRRTPADRPAWPAGSRRNRARPDPPAAASATSSRSRAPNVRPSGGPASDASPRRAPAA